MPNHLINLTHLPSNPAKEVILTESEADSQKSSMVLAQEHLRDGNCYFEALAELSGLDIDLIRDTYQQQIISAQLERSPTVFSMGGFLTYGHSPRLFPAYGYWDFGFNSNRDLNFPQKQVINKNFFRVDSYCLGPLRETNPTLFDGLMEQVGLAANPILHDYLHNLFPVELDGYARYAQAEKEVGISRAIFGLCSPLGNYETHCQALHASMLCNTTALTPLRQQMEKAVSNGLEIANDLLHEFTARIGYINTDHAATEIFRFFAWLCWHCPSMKLPSNDDGVLEISQRRSSYFGEWNFQNEIMAAGRAVAGFDRNLSEPPSNVLKRYVENPELAGTTARKLILSLAPAAN